MLIITGMAMTRTDAIDICIHLGRQFIGLFHKVFATGNENQEFNRCCEELQSIWDRVSLIRIKPYGGRIPYSKMSEWFFRAGAEVADFLENEKEQDCYELLMKELERGDNMEAVITELFEYNKEPEKQSDSDKDSLRQDAEKDKTVNDALLGNGICICSEEEV